MAGAEEEIVAEQWLAFWLSVHVGVTGPFASNNCRRCKITVPNWKVPHLHVGKRDGRATGREPVAVGDLVGLEGGVRPGLRGETRLCDGDRSGLAIYCATNEPCKVTSIVSRTSGRMEERKTEFSRMCSKRQR